MCPSVLTASSLTACQWPAGVDITGLKNNSITLCQSLFQEQTDAQTQQPTVLMTVLWRVMWGFGGEGFLQRLSKCQFDLVPWLDGGNTSNTDIERWTKKELKGRRNEQNQEGKGVIVLLKCQWCHPALITSQQQTVSPQWTNRVTTVVECGKLLWDKVEREI